MQTLFPGIVCKYNRIYTINIYNRNYQIVGVISANDKNMAKAKAEGLKSYLVGTELFSLN